MEEGRSRLGWAAVLSFVALTLGIVFVVHQSTVEGDPLEQVILIVAMNCVCCWMGNCCSRCQRLLRSCRAGNLREATTIRHASSEFRLNLHSTVLDDASSLFPEHLSVRRLVRCGQLADSE